ncbi:MAG: ABC transporter ATP-binding protein/permease [Anaerolineae bacterium]|nr:ABC transporter ATP-binding protein/permease [Anaerolineae bacterium]
MRELFVFLKPYKKETILGPLFKLFEAILELLLPTLMALIINRGVNRSDTNYVLHMGALMMVMALLGFGSSMVCQYYAARASQGFGTTLRNALFKHISSFSYAEVDRFGTATLINRLTNDVNQLQLAVAMLIRLVIRAPFICLGAIIMAMILDFKLSLILLAITPLFALILYLIISRSSPLYQQYQQKMDGLTLVLRENLAGVRVIRAFTRKKDEQKRFNQASDDLTATAVRVGGLSALLNPLTSLVMNAAVIAILWTGGLRINAGALSQGEIIAFVNYVTQILLALIVVSNLVIIFTRAYASAGRVSEVLAVRPSIVDAKPAEKTTDAAPKALIEFKQVSFAYSATGERVLDDISVVVNRGETVGIIGGTGSGKSSFINLIPRFYDVLHGEVLVDGVNVKNYNLSALRQKMGIVPQKVLLFSGTLAENIRWGKQDASEEEMIAAARAAQADEFISSLPEAYRTPVERGGVNLSGGQRQRLSIARALLARPQILILDDAASALDFATEAALRQAIRCFNREMTVLIVSQRVSSIKQADKILVFDDGHLLGLGNHVSLLNDNAVYREIYYSQMADGEGQS